jgi:hypothetical protein
VTLGYLQSSGRQFFSANKTVYISPSGSDSTGDGSSSNPWATLQHAYNQVQGSIDFHGFTVTIEMADGTYTGGLQASGAPIGAVGSGPIIVRGNTSDSSAVTINVSGAPCIYATVDASVQVEYCTLTSINVSGSGGTAIAADYGGEVLFNNVVFGPYSNNHIFCERRRRGHGHGQLCDHRWRLITRAGLDRGLCAIVILAERSSNGDLDRHADFQHRLCPGQCRIALCAGEYFLRWRDRNALHRATQWGDLYRRQIADVFPWSGRRLHADRRPIWLRRTR